MKLFKLKKGSGECWRSIGRPRFTFFTVSQLSPPIIMKEKEELCKEPKEMKEEAEEGITAKMAKEVSKAKNEPPKEGV